MLADNHVLWGFSWSGSKNGHFVVIVGYRDPSTIIIADSEEPTSNTFYLEVDYNTMTYADGSKIVNKKFNDFKINKEATIVKKKYVCIILTLICMCFHGGINVMADSQIYVGDYEFRSINGIGIIRMDKKTNEVLKLLDFPTDFYIVNNKIYYLDNCVTDTHFSYKMNVRSIYNMNLDGSDKRVFINNSIGCTVYDFEIQNNKLWFVEKSVDSGGYSENVTEIQNGIIDNKDNFIKKDYITVRGNEILDMDIKNNNIYTYSDILSEQGVSEYNEIIATNIKTGNEVSVKVKYQPQYYKLYNDVLFYEDYSYLDSKETLNSYNDKNKKSSIISETDPSHPFWFFDDNSNCVYYNNGNSEFTKTNIETTKTEIVLSNYFAIGFAGGEYQYIFLKSKNNENDRKAFNLKTDEIVDDINTIDLNGKIHNNYINGYEDITFKPDNKVTREEFVKMLYQYGANSANSYAETSIPYKDIKFDRWSANAILYSKQIGLIDGYPDGNFYPENTITFAEACKILCRLNGFEVSQTSENVHWGQAYIYAIEKNCKLDTVFDLDYEMTRRNIVKLINAVEEIVPDKANIDEMSASPFTDLDKTDPDYYNIVEATLTRVNSDTE